MPDIRTATRRALIVGVALTLAFGLGGCSAIQGLLGGESVTRDESGTVTEEGTANIFSISVGDCVQLPDDDEISDITAVPCTDPHDAEVYYDFEMPEGEWPGDDAVTAAAYDTCEPEFTNFIGLSADESKYDWNVFTPLKEGWEDSTLQDRLITCFVYTDDGSKIEGSLKGANS